jgi:acyl-CoA thioesterase-1
MRYILFVALVCLAGCGRGVPENARVVVAGDSVMAWNRSSNASVADALSRELNMAVGDVSLPFARVLSGTGALNIPDQLGGVTAPWIVMNGGANDIGISCEGGTSTVERLINSDGTAGAIPGMVADLRARGSRVVWADYYTLPRFAGRRCLSYEQLENRVARMAARDAGVVFVDMDDVIASSDASLFASDGTHPSPEGSSRIARLIAQAMRQAGFTTGN